MQMGDDYAAWQRIHRPSGLWLSAATCLMTAEIEWRRPDMGGKHSALLASLGNQPPGPFRRRVCVCGEGARVCMYVSV